MGATVCWATCQYNLGYSRRTIVSDQEKAADTERKGNRLSKIVTRTGDAGTTGLGDGSRTTKDSLRIDAIGEVDELNSSLGLLLCEELPARVRAALLDIQHDLFDLGGELCLPGMAIMKDAQVARLEELVEEFNRDLPMLKEFILPGGTRPAAIAHLCRTICRRAERSMVRLNTAEPLSDAARRFINRLSDLLFILGRLLNRAGGRGDVLWQKGKNAA
ncbi:MAG: cob(I)yrinic acid a,c-diamide adenosyltransferase [Dechloromonas sp.]|nr:cob(I)yrinic acid a,c-diamide adenosyltransferase [Dechloromonas sp.]